MTNPHPDLPYRGLAEGLPAGLPLSPSTMPLIRGGRLRKRWRYVGVYGAEIMICVASVEIGPVRQSFWAVWDRVAGRLYENTAMRRHPVRLTPGRVLVTDGDATIDLAFTEQDAVQIVTPDAGQFTWTRKMAPLRVRGIVEIGPRLWDVDALAIVDDSAGYHARHTAWTWSAGVGLDPAGNPVAWNLVAGINDQSTNSERSVWSGGQSREVGPVCFAPDLSSVSFHEGGSLTFNEESRRARDENRLIIRSSYVQPFGTFSGTLPGAIEVAEGYGVMEKHDVYW